MSPIMGQTDKIGLPLRYAQGHMLYNIPTKTT